MKVTIELEYSRGNVNASLKFNPAIASTSENGAVITKLYDTLVSDARSLLSVAGASRKEVVPVATSGYVQVVGDTGTTDPVNFTSTVTNIEEPVVETRTTRLIEQLKEQNEGYKVEVAGDAQNVPPTTVESTPEVQSEAKSEDPAEKVSDTPVVVQESKKSKKSKVVDLP